MRKHFLLILFFVSTTVFSLDINGTTWGPEKSGFGYYLKFITEKNFEFAFSGEGGGQYAKGTYTVKDNEVMLNVIMFTEWGELPAYITQKNVKCAIVETDSVFSKYKLVGNGGLELWSLNHKQDQGKKCIIGRFVIYAYQTDGKVTENARIRSGPGLQYTSYSFSIDEDQPILYSLPKGHGIKIYGYSEDKTIVDGVEMPWYYCSFRSMWEEQFGWIWGGLIDMR